MHQFDRIGMGSLVQQGRPRRHVRGTMPTASSTDRAFRNEAKASGAIPPHPRTADARIRVRLRFASLQLDDDLIDNRFAGFRVVVPGRPRWINWAKLIFGSTTTGRMSVRFSSAAIEVDRIEDAEDLLVDLGAQAGSPGPSSARTGCGCITRRMKTRLRDRGNVDAGRQQIDRHGDLGQALVAETADQLSGPCPRCR